MRFEVGSVLSRCTSFPPIRDDASDLRAMLRLLAMARGCVGPASFVTVVMRELYALVPYDQVCDHRVELDGSDTRAHFVPAVEHGTVTLRSIAGDPPVHRRSIIVGTESQTTFELVLGRSFDPFSAHETALLDDLLPHLAAALEHAALRQERLARHHDDSALADYLKVLTPRERQIAMLLANGSSNRAIARALDISDRTAEKHVGNVLAKLGVRNRTAVAAVLARRSA